MFKSKWDVVGLILFVVLLGLLLVCSIGCEQCQSSVVREVSSLGIEVTRNPEEPSSYDASFDTWQLSTDGVLEKGEFWWKVSVYGVDGEPLNVPRIRLVTTEHRLISYYPDMPAVDMIAPQKIYVSQEGLSIFKTYTEDWDDVTLCTGTEYAVIVDGKEDSKKYLYGQLRQYQGYDFFERGGAWRESWQSVADESLIPNADVIIATKAYSASPMTTKKITMSLPLFNFPITEQESQLFLSEQEIACCFSWLNGQELVPATTIISSNILAPAEIEELLPTLVASIVIDTQEGIYEQTYEGGVCSVLENNILQELPCKYYYVSSCGTKHLYRSEYIVPTKNKLSSPIYIDSKGNRNIILYCPVGSLIQLQSKDELLVNLAENWLGQGPNDINNDGTVNFQDYTMLIN